MDRVRGRREPFHRSPASADTMIVSFRDEGTRDIFEGSDTRAARTACPQSLWKGAHRKLQALDTAQTLAALTMPAGNRLEKLTGDRAGQHSIRINRQYRVCFWWTHAGPAEVEIGDYH
jgi:proteic killer suppression protein